jgi:hypothetical protein
MQLFVCFVNPLFLQRRRIFSILPIQLLDFAGLLLRCRSRKRTIANRTPVVQGLRDCVKTCISFIESLPLSYQPSRRSPALAGLLGPLQKQEAHYSKSSGDRASDSKRQRPVRLTPPWRAPRAISCSCRANADAARALPASCWSASGRKSARCRQPNRALRPCAHFRTCGGN